MTFDRPLAPSFSKYTPATNASTKSYESKSQSFTPTTNFSNTKVGTASTTNSTFTKSVKPSSALSSFAGQRLISTATPTPTSKSTVWNPVSSLDKSSSISIPLISTPLSLNNSQYQPKRIEAPTVNKVAPVNTKSQLSPIKIERSVSVSSGKQKAYVIIFNHESFANSNSKRLGTELDVEFMKKLFKRFRFDVNIYKDYKLRDIEKEVERCEYSFISLMMLLTGYLI